MVGFDPSPPPVKEWITLKVCALAAGVTIVVIANTVARTSTTIPARRLMSKIEAALCFEAAIGFLLDRLRAMPPIHGSVDGPQPAASHRPSRRNYCALILR